MNTYEMRRTQFAAAPQQRSRRTRRPELDWLRTLIVLGIIPYHALIMFYTASNTVIKQTFAAPFAPLLGGALEGWGIALIFLLAGAASKFALDASSPRTYVSARLLRLLPPLVVTALLFAPLHAYFLQLSHPGPASAGSGPFADPERLRNIGVFYLAYWTSLFTTGRPLVLGNMFLYLWFIPRLLVVSVICLPLFGYLRRRWPRWIDRLAPSGLALDLLVAVGGGLLAGVLVTLLEPGVVTWVTPVVPLIGGRTQFTLDLIAFVVGYLLYSSGRLLGAVRRLAYVTLGMAVVLWAVVLLIRGRGSVPATTFSFSPPAMLLSLAQTFAVWTLLLAVLGLALRYLAVAPSWQRYLTTATFPVYVLHTPLLILAATYLQVLPGPWSLHLVLNSALTIAAAFVLYEFVVRRIPLTRFLFGLGAPQPTRGRPGHPVPPPEHGAPTSAQPTSERPVHPVPPPEHGAPPRQTSPSISQRPTGVT